MRLTCAPQQHQYQQQAFPCSEHKAALASGRRSSRRPTSCCWAGQVPVPDLHVKAVLGRFGRVAKRLYLIQCNPAAGLLLHLLIACLTCTWAGYV